jgi:hypothetical protein
LNQQVTSPEIEIRPLRAEQFAATETRRVRFRLTLPIVTALPALRRF